MIEKNGASPHKSAFLRILDDNQKHFDERFNKLETAFEDKFLKQLEALTKAIDSLSSTILAGQKVYATAIPLKLVFYIITLVVAGEAAIKIVHFLIP